MNDINGEPSNQTLEKQLLTKEEERDLLNLAVQGNKEAEHKLVMHNLLLVKSIADRYTTRSLDFDDLVQEGVIGLLRAIRKFDLTQKGRLSTYASRWINASIVRAIEKYDRTITIPNPVYWLERKMKKTKNELSSQSKDPVTIEDIAEKMELSVNEVKRLCNIQEPMSLQTTLPGSDQTLEVALADPDEISLEDQIIDQMTKNEVKKQIELTLENLKQQEREIIHLLFGFNGEQPKNPKEVGMLYNISREGIRQKKVKILKQLKTSIFLTQFLDFNPESIEIPKNSKEEQTMLIPSLYELLKETSIEYSKEEIDTAISLLMEEDKIPLVDYQGNYGSIFEGTNSTFQKITQMTIPKLKSLLEYQRRTRKQKRI